MKARESARLRAGSRVYQRVPHILLWLRRVVHHNNQYSQMIERRDLMAIESGKLVIVMVGLPGRGKSYISRRLSQYLSFFYNVPCKMFNVGDYRREKAGNGFQDAEFFNTNNATAMALRREATEAAMQDLCIWMKETCTEPKGLQNADGSPRPTPPEDGHTFVSGDFGAVAMFDATNTTRERRRWVIERSKETGAKVRGYVSRAGRHHALGRARSARRCRLP